MTRYIDAQGEALGLRRQDVDLDRGRMRVVHQLQRVDSKLTLVDLKAELSRRTLVLPASTWLKPRQHHDRQLEEKQLRAVTGRTDERDPRLEP
jgi:integrase